jgi:hypothetical protein
MRRSADLGAAVGAAAAVAEVTHPPEPRAAAAEKEDGAPGAAAAAVGAGMCALQGKRPEKAEAVDLAAAEEMREVRAKTAAISSPPEWRVEEPAAAAECFSDLRRTNLSTTESSRRLAEPVPPLLAAAAH